MPILKPDIQKALQAAGIDSRSGSGNSVSEKLDNAGLAIHDILGELAGIISRSDNDSVRLKGIEMVLKTHGVLKENQAPPIPTVNIVINDPGAGAVSINPILIPRGALKVQ